MTEKELIDFFKKVEDFTNKIVPRAQKLQDIENPRDNGTITGIDWEDSYSFFDQNKKKEVCVFSFIADDGYNRWRPSFDTEKLADDFDIEAYQKEVLEKRQKEEENIKEAKEKKEREEYERLKKKFE